MKITAGRIGKSEEFEGREREGSVIRPDMEHKFGKKKMI